MTKKASLLGETAASTASKHWTGLVYPASGGKMAAV